MHRGIAGTPECDGDKQQEVGQLLGLRRTPGKHTRQAFGVVGVAAARQAADQYDQLARAEAHARAGDLQIFDEALVQQFVAARRGFG